MYVTGTTTSNANPIFPNAPAAPVLGVAGGQTCTSPRSRPPWRHRYGDDAMEPNETSKLLLERETDDGTDVDEVLGCIPGQSQPVGATGHAVAATSPTAAADHREPGQPPR